MDFNYKIVDALKKESLNSKGEMCNLLMYSYIYIQTLHEEIKRLENELNKRWKVRFMKGEKYGIKVW